MAISRRAIGNNSSEIVFRNHVACSLALIDLMFVEPDVKPMNGTNMAHAQKLGGKAQIIARQTSISYYAFGP